MSGPGTPTSAAAPKQLSSRLSNMKFMLRGEAAGNGVITPTPEPSSKRRRIETSSQTSTPVSSRTASSSRIEGYRALAQARQEAPSPTTPWALQEGHETEWVLDVQLPHVNGNLANGTAQGSGPDGDEIWSSRATGRQTFGSFKKRKTEPKPASEAVNIDDEELSSASDSADSGLGPPNRAESFSLRKGDRTKDLKQQHLRKPTSDSASPLRVHAQKQEEKKRKRHDKHDKKKFRKTI